MTLFPTVTLSTLALAAGLFLTGCEKTATAPSANETAPVSPATAPPAQVPAASANADPSGATTGAQANADTPPVHKK